MNNYTDELIESQELTELIYGGYTSPYLQLPESERTAAANAFTKTMKDEKYIDYELLHKSLDAALYHMGLLGMFNEEGAFTGRGSYAHLKEYPDQKNGVISFLKKIWSAVYGSQFGNVTKLPAKTKADKEAEEKLKQEKAAKEALNAQHETINKQALALENAEAICGRAEDILREDGFRENYDFCISRAVANLSTLAEYCIPFVKLGGQFIAYKSDPDSEEIKEAKNAITILGGEISRLEKFDLPGTDEKRCFVFVDKISDTDLKYPRRAGIPLKRPLK